MRTLLVLVLVSLASLPVAASAPPLPSGSWAYAGGTSETQKMERAVDAVVDDMNALIRPIARPRLKSEARPWTHVAIEAHGERITIRHDAEAVTSPLGQKITGEAGVEITRTLRDGVLVETWAEKRGGRTNEYRVTEDGLQVVSTIFSSQLPRPLRFSYTYR